MAQIAFICFTLLLMAGLLLVCGRWTSAQSLRSTSRNLLLFVGNVW